MYCIINNNKQAQSKAVIGSLHFADSGKKAPVSELQRRVSIIWATREGNALGVIKARIHRGRRRWPGAAFVVWRGEHRSAPQNFPFP